MEVKFKKGRGSFSTHGEFAQRYNVIAKPHTSNMDWTQFWTWLKYETTVDYNDRAKVVGCKEYTLKQIRSQWGDKFWFET